MMKQFSRALNNFDKDKNAKNKTRQNCPGALTPTRLMQSRYIYAGIAPE